MGRGNVCVFGDYEGIYKERYFNFINEDILNEVIKDTNLSILDIIYTDDVRRRRWKIRGYVYKWRFKQRI